MKDAQNVDIHGNKFNSLLLIISILLGGFMTVLTETSLNNGLPAIEQALHVSTSTVQWLSTGYMLVVGIMMPISATLLYKFTSKKLYLTSLIIFLVGSTIAYVAPSFSILLIGRLIQAASVGIIMPFMQNILVMIFPVEKRGMAMGLAGIVIALAPAIGPTLSGWIVDNYSWRLLFGMMIPIAVVVILLAMLGMRDVVETTNPKLDWLSILESTIGFGGILYGFSTIGSGNTIIAIAAIIIGIIGVTFMVRRQLGMKTPMLDMRVFKSSTFTLTTWLSSISNMSLLGMQLLVPLYLQAVLHVSALNAGIVMLPGAIMMAITNPIAGTLFDRFGIRNLAIIGFTIFTLATIPFLFFTSSTSLVLIAVIYAIWMTGVLLVVMQLATAGINTLSPELVAHGNAVNSMARQIAAAVGSALLISIAGIGTSMLGSAQIGYQLAFGAVVLLSIVGWIGTFRLKNKTEVVTV
ncbi:major facilitator superfamily permease [Lactobacillus selangorensis]|uniref:Major facilitator superfamily permease n=1 Tax=Lactobacillus selangorensis TaxID=81857 RepID=A0A0R2FKA1_9LACO|nr:MDR family MFS transporter [Lactobacillus selangorensis]KRN29065.1 major facilitator superfamily permease [Lactobacillus selangorensis]KRN30022.1 major facilitator superfamily permease [Lactobacillus selangorensis]